MKKLWQRLGPFTQGMVLGYLAVFIAIPILWLFSSCIELFFPGAFK